MYTVISSPNLWTSITRCQTLFLGKNCRYEPLQIPKQEKSPVEIIIHVDTNDSFNDKGPMDIANDIIQLSKSVTTDASKVAVSSILPRKDRFNN